MTLRFDVSYNVNSGEREQQSQLLKYQNHTWSITPSLSWRAWKSLNIEYALSSYFSGVTMGNSSLKTYLPTIDNRMQLYWNITDRFALSNNLQHIYTKAVDNNVSKLLFWDMGLAYTLKQVSFHLYWTNILNHHEQLQTRHSSVNTISLVNRLRPAELFLTVRFKKKLLLSDKTVNNEK